MSYNLKDIMLYICKNYPHKNELSNARLTKMIYLADWKNVLKNKEQISNIKWIFNHYGPFVNDVLEEAYNNPDIFNVTSEPNMYGHIKQVINCCKEIEIDLNKIFPVDIKNNLDIIIDKTKTKSWNQFIQYVYSTYPVLTSEKGTELNLIEIEKKYRDAQNDFQK